MSHTGFNLAKVSLLSYQQALNITSQNVTNIQNPEYSRMTVRIRSNILNNPSNINKDLSMGVKVGEIERSRDELLTNYFRVENNNLATLETQQKQYGEIEFVFNELGDFKLGDNISSFWQSWQALQDSPDDMSIRKNVIQVGGFLADSIVSKKNQLDDLSSSIVLDTDFQIRQINNLFDQLADVNKNIVKAFNETSAEKNQLMDRRDAIVDSLTGYADFQVVKAPDESVNLYLNGAPVFYQETHRTMSQTLDGTGMHFWLSNNAAEINLTGGKLYGYKNIHDTVIPDYVNQFNTFTKDLVDNINALHQRGYGKDGSAGQQFFTTTLGQEAGTIKLNVTDPVNVAAALATNTSSSVMARTNKTIDQFLTIASQSKASSAMAFKGYLDSNDPAGTIYTTTMTGYDSLGGETALTATFVKVDATRWTYATVPAKTAADGKGMIWFNADGSFNKVTGFNGIDPAPTDVVYTPANGAPDVTIALNFTQTRQFASDSTLSLSSQDGANNFAISPNTAGGTFTINGVAFTWTTADSIYTIMKKINDSNVAALPANRAGVIASFDPQLQKLTLTKDPSVTTTAATPGITISDDGLAGSFCKFTYLNDANLNKNETGSGANALYLSQLWHRKTVGTPPSWTINEEYSALSNTIAKQKNLIDNLYSNKKRLVDNINIKREAESSVSLDEELINLMKYQQAYAACSRLVTVSDDLLDRIINRTGRVGL